MLHRSIRTHVRNSIALGALLAGLGACNHSQKIADWQPKLPESWHETRVPQATEVAAATPLQQWWKQWNDPALDAIVTQALSQNLALKQVAERVEKARAIRDEAEATLWPQVGVQSSAKRANQGLLTRGNTETIADVDVAAQWEVDLFGKLRAARTAAEADTLANAANLRGSKLVLIGEVVKAYIELRHAQSQLVIAKHVVASQTEQVSLLDARRAGGLDDGMAASQARTVLLDAQAAIPRWNAVERTALNRLNLLAAVKVGALDAHLAPPSTDAEAAGLPPIVPSVVLAAPASVIAQRPDVAEAEARLRVAKAFQDVAVANQYPSLDLSSLFGLQYTSSLNTSRIWSVGAGVAAPLFTFGKMQAQIDQADADARAAFAGYKASILVALEETETALSRYCYGLQQMDERASAVLNAKDVLAIAQERYRSGVSNYLDVLDAQRGAFATQQALAETRMNTAMHLLAIYQALGVGGADDAPAASAK